MTTKYLQSGTLVSLNNKIYSLLRKIDDTVWQLEEQATKRIIEHTESDILAMFGNELKFVSGNLAESNEEKRLYSTLVAKGKTELTEDAKVRYLYVKQTLGVPATKALLTPAIEQIWKKLGCPGTRPHFSSVCRWRKRYLEGNRTISRLISQIHRRGNRHARFPTEVVLLTQDVIDRLYMTLERNTVQDVIDQAQLEVIRENRLRPAAAQLPLPSRRFVRSLVESIPAYDRYVARYGRDAAHNKFRSVIGHRTTKFPLERAEIDHTRLDIMVIDDETGLPLGRPWFSSCIDDETRSILGIHVGFADPSYSTVAKCLQHAFRPKTYLKEAQPDLVNDWHAFGVMQELVVDNGAEFHSQSLENACLLLGIEIHYSARKTPWFKGKIERFLGSLNRGVAHGNPGTTFSNIFEKGDYDPCSNAVIRLSALKEAINIWIVDHYHQKPHRTTKVPPCVAWKNKISIEDIRLPENPQLLDAVSGKSEHRKLTHKGIEYNSLYYSSPELHQLRRQYGDKLDVEIRVNEEDIGQIHVISLCDKSVLVVPAIAKEYASGMTEWQHDLCKQYAAKQLHKYNDPTVWLEAKERIRAIFDAEGRWKKRAERSRRAAEKQVQKRGKASNPVSVEQPISKKESDELFHEPLAKAAPIDPETIVATAPRQAKRFAPVQQNRQNLLQDQI